MPNHNVRPLIALRLTTFLGLNLGSSIGSSQPACTLLLLEKAKAFVCQGLCRTARHFGYLDAADW